MTIRWDRAPYGRKAFFVDTKNGRYLVDYNKITKRWDVKFNGILRAEANSEQSAKDYVAIQVFQISLSD